MQYNDEANNQDICSLADRLAKSNIKSYPLKDKTLFANMGSKEIWSWIFEAYGGWHYDDINNTDLPEATSAISANETFVALPLDSAHLMGVAFKDTSGYWNKLKPITLEQIQDMGYTEADFMTTPGLPEYYRPVANGFKPYPAPNFTQAASWKIWISRDVVSFTIADTTEAPGFASEFHEAVPTYMALQYAKINLGADRILSLQRDWDGNENTTGKEGGFKKRIKSFYGNRFRQLFPPRIKTKDSVREYI